MPTPTNTTAATAMVITSLPFMVTQDVADQANTLELWYVYTGVENDLMLGCVPYADISGTYLPKLYVYTGTASSLTGFKIFGSQQRACEIPIEAGTNYFFKVIQGGATSPLGDSLTFRAVRAPNTDAPVESVISTEENANMRTPILSTATDNLVLSYIEDIDFMQSVMGTTLANGNFIGDGVSGNPDALNIFTSDLERIYNAVPSYYAFTPEFISSDTEKFYLLYSPVFGANRVVRTLMADGSETSDVWTLDDSVGIESSSPNRESTIFYYRGTSMEIHAWDLVNDVALPDLAAPVATYNVGREILVLADGSICVCYLKSGDAFIRRYDPDGSTLSTYPLGNVDIHHCALSYANPLAFWVWLHTTSNTRTVYRQILVSDGSTVTESQFDMFANGPSAVNYDTAAYASVSDVPLFGPASTCTFFITTAAVTPPEPPIPPEFEIEEDPIRWLRRSPIQASENRRVFWELFSVEIDPGVGVPSGDEEDENPHVMMRYSDDNGRTWSKELWRAMGRVGKWATRLEWWRLGQGRNRVFEVSGSAKVHTVLIDGYAQVTPSTDSPLGGGQ